MLDHASVVPERLHEPSPAQAALTRLALPLVGLAAAAPDEDPLFLAATAVVHRLGLEAMTPVARGGSLATLAEANGLRLRRVALVPGWWRADPGPLLLCRPAGPAALLPGRTLYDPTTGRTAPLSVTEAAALRGEAFQLYVPLPAKPLGGSAIIRRVLRWGCGDAAAIIVLGLLAGLLGLSVPVATGFMVETLIPAHDVPDLLQAGGALAILAMVAGLLRLATQVAALRIECHVGTRLQAAVLDRLLSLPVSFFRGKAAGELAQNTLAIQAIEKSAGAAAIGAIAGGLQALTAIAMMLAYAPRLVLPVLPLILAMAGLILVLGVLRQRRELAARQVEAQQAGLLLQLVQGIAKLRLAMAEDRAFLRWARLQADGLRHRLGSATLARGGELANTLYPLLATTVVFLAVHLMADQSPGHAARPALPLGQLAAFLAAFAQANAGIATLAGAVVQLAGLPALYRQAAPILQAVPEVRTEQVDPGPLTGAIGFRNLVFRYGAGAPPLFNGLTLDIAPGEFVAIVGVSGGGKSTLLRLLLGFETPEAGHILVDGRDLRGLSIDRVRRQCGVVLQHDRLLPATILDNILAAQSDLNEQDAWRAAAQVGLAKDIRAMPMGMRTLLADGGGLLSGGQAQRVLLARALVARPRLLLLDEATSALDNRTQTHVMRGLAGLGITRLMIAHRLSTVLGADRVIVLENGSIQESGTPAALLAAGGAFSVLAARQSTDGDCRVVRL